MMEITAAVSSPGFIAPVNALCVLLYPIIQCGEWPISPYELSLPLNTLVEVEVNGFYVRRQNFSPQEP